MYDLIDKGPRWKGFNSVFTAMQRSLSATVAHSTRLKTMTLLSQ